MTKPKITFRNMSTSEALVNHIQDLFQKLHDTFGELTNCEITLEAPSRHHVTGHPFRAHMHVHAMRHNYDATSENEDAYLATKNVFAQVRKQMDRTLTKLNSDRVSVKEAL